MKFKTLIALTAAGVCTFANAAGQRADAPMPASVSESAPTLPGKPAVSGSAGPNRPHIDPSTPPRGTGATDSTAGSGSGRFDSPTPATNSVQTVDYWLLGADSERTDATAIPPAPDAIRR